MNRDDIDSLFGSLLSYRLDFGPDVDGVPSVKKLWLDVLGHLRAVDVQTAIRAYLSGPEAKRWPQPAQIAALVSGRKSTDGDVKGCSWCGGSGARLARWVTWHNKFFEGSLQVLCDCDRGSWLAAEHRRSTSTSEGCSGPPEMKTAAQVARELDGLNRLTLDDCEEGRKGVLWWVIEDRRTDWDELRMPDPIRRALDEQGELLRAVERRKARLVQTETRTPTGRRAGAVRRPAPADDDGRWQQVAK